MANNKKDYIKTNYTRRTWNMYQNVVMLVRYIVFIYIYFAKKYKKEYKSKIPYMFGKINQQKSSSYVQYMLYWYYIIVNPYIYLYVPKKKCLIKQNFPSYNV